VRTSMRHLVTPRVSILLSAPAMVLGTGAPANRQGNTPYGSQPMLAIITQGLNEPQANSRIPVIHKLVRSLMLIFFAVAGLCGNAAHGQGAQFGAVDFRVGREALIVNDPPANNGFDGIAVDASGNLYIGGCAPIPADAYSVCKETLQPDGTFVETVLFTPAANGFYNPYFVAVDSSGNVYVTDFNNSRVLKETLSGGTYTQSVVTDYHNGLIFPQQIAVDSAGNVYVTDPDNKRVLKETPSGSTYTQTILGSGFSTPYAVAVDSAGDVFIGDNATGNLYKETPSGSSYTQSTILAGLNSGDGFQQLAVDGHGTIYASDDGAVQVIIPTATGYLYSSSAALDVLGEGLGTGVAVDSANNLYVSGNFDNVVKFSFPSLSFAPVAVGSTGPVVTIPFYSPAGYTGTQSYLEVSGAAVSMGASGEFTDTGAGTCDTNGLHTYAKGEVCTVTVTFSPKAAGVRKGSLELVNGSGVAIETIYISGVGTAPQVAFSSGPQTTVASGLVSPTGVTVNGSGVVYIADPGTPGYIFLETPSGSGYTQSTINKTVTVASEELIPGGVTIDGAGNLFYSSSNTDPTYGNYVENYEYYNGANWGSTPLAYPQLKNGLLGPTGLAADPSGNIYIADTGNNRVVEEYYIDGATYDTYNPLQFVVASGLSTPEAVATDASGNVYIADTGNNRILLETATGLGGFTQSVLFSNGLSAPAGVAVDGLGDVFISDTGNKRVLMELHSGTSYTQSVVPVANLVSPQGLTVDASENLFVADSGSGSVFKIALGTGPTLNFASTNVGSTSSDSPQTVMFSNIGNAPLSFPIPGTGTNPSVSTSFSVSSTGSTACPTLTTSAGSAATLAAATSCTLPISFSPVASGNITGAVKATDNALNVSGTVQTITLNGTGTAASAPVASLSPVSIAFGNQAVSTTSAASTIVLSNTGNASLTGISVSITGANPADFTQTNTCGTTLVASATCTISVIFTPTLVTSFMATVSVSDNASGSPQMAKLTGTGTAPQAVLTPTTLAFPNTAVGSTSTSMSTVLSNPGTATLNITGITVTGANTADFAISANTCGATLAAAATCMISVTFTPASAATFTASISVADNAAGSPQTAVLSGTGTASLAPQAILTPTTLSFPNTTVGNTATSMSTVLSNSGTSTLNIAGITVTGTNSADFAITANSCGATLAAATTCTISVTFTPASAATFTASISVADNASGSPQTATLTGAGTAPAATDFTLSSPTPSQSVRSGSAAVFTIDTTALTGGSYNTPILLTVTGLPTGAIAIFNPSTITPGSGTAISQLSIQTPSLLAAMGTSSPSLWLATLLGLPMLLLRRRIRRLHCLLLVAFLGSALLVSGCGGGYLGNHSATYTVTVTGTSGPIQHSTTVTLTVQ